MHMAYRLVYRAYRLIEGHKFAVGGLIVEAEYVRTSNNWGQWSVVNVCIRRLEDMKGTAEVHHIICICLVELLKYLICPSWFVLTIVLPISISLLVLPVVCLWFMDNVYLFALSYG